VVIEFSNAKNDNLRSLAAPFLVVAVSLAFFVPALLILIGIYSQTPTGTLISPVPEGVLTQLVTEPQSPVTTSTTSAIIAADSDSTVSSSTQDITTNTSEFHATFPANLSEIEITNEAILESSSIYLLPDSQDQAVYFVKSKKAGSFILVSTTVSGLDRTLDYQIANP